MRNFKRVGIVLSLLMAIGLGSLVYASDFNTPQEGYSHCYETGNKSERHHRIGHHKDNRHHRINHHGMHNNGRRHMR